ncbi:MAG TPA: hypothetical protein VFD97_07650 [Acidimicrobiia bacterium]|nr:hypothetical protein [Acidimicrobiia bacterium]
MVAYIARRVVYGLVTLLALSMIVFMLLQLSGGGPLDRLKLNPRMQPVIQQLTEQWGLDQPVWKQYVTWLGHYVRPSEISLHNALPFVAVAAAIAGTVALGKFMTSHWKGAAVLLIWAIAVYVTFSNLTITFD